MIRPARCKKVACYPVGCDPVEAISQYPVAEFKLGGCIIDYETGEEMDAVLPAVNVKSVVRGGEMYFVGADQPRFTDNGLLLEGQATNVYPYGEEPQNTSLTLTAAQYTVSVWQGSATIGGVTATPGSPQTFTAVAGSNAITVSGDAFRVQVELGKYATSYIPTNGTEVARATEAGSATNGIKADLVNKFPAVYQALESGIYTVVHDIVAVHDYDATTFISSSVDSKRNGLYINNGNSVRFSLGGAGGDVSVGNVLKGDILRMAASVDLSGTSYIIGIKNSVLSSATIPALTYEQITEWALNVEEESAVIHSGLKFYDRNLDIAEVANV